MSAATTFPLMTVEQFDALPEPRGNFTYELHFGRLVKVGRAKKSHYLLQCFVRDLLRRHVDSKKWFTEIEMAYNLVEGYDARAADVAVVSRERYDKVPGEGYLTVSPELVVFIKSRSNRDTQIEKDAIECLTHGAEAAWYVKYNPDVVYVYTAAGKKEYRPGQSIPLPASMSGRIKVRDIFKNLPR
jgi:Uma2 family endonuclease